jgi:cell division protein FtsB
MALALSGAATASVLWFTAEGLPSLHRRQAELLNHKINLFDLSKQNRKLFDEVQRLNIRDPELMEAMVRRLGYDRPGEKVYVFGDQKK